MHWVITRKRNAEILHFATWNCTIYYQSSQRKKFLFV